MQQRFLLLSILLLSFCVNINIQAEAIGNDMLHLILIDIYEQLTEDGNEVDFEELEITLSDLHDNPIDLNTAGEQELRRLFFLNDNQIDAILLFIYKQPLNDLCELRLIDNLADYEIRNMLPFVTISKQQLQEPFYWRDMWHYAKHEVNVRFDARNIENNGTDPFYAAVKYRFKYKSRVDAGLTAERDPQEPLYYKHKTYGADFYGGWLQLNDIGKLRTLTLGDFRASFGQGLVLNTNVNYGGKTACLHNSGFGNYGIKSKTSNAEYGFLRGVGAMLRFGLIDITMLYSARKVDGRVSEGIFPSIQQTGYHRTQTELEAKREVWQQVIGINATLRLKQARIGITATQDILGDTLVPRRTYYNEHYFSGNRQAAIGLNYDWRFWRMQLFGEIATAQNNKWGLGNLTGFRYVPLSGLTLTALYRYYSPYFDNMLASGFAETNRLNDEQGLLVGAEMQMFRQWRMSLYGDYYRFSGPKYGIRTASSGFDICAVADYFPTEQLTMQWKTRVKLKGTSTKYSFRYILLARTENWRFKTGVETNLVKVKDSIPTLGGMLYQQVEYHAIRFPLVLQSRVEAFYAHDYENRMYAYENDVLYAYSIPQIYGVGGRWYLNLRCKINKYLSVYLKCAQSVFLDEIIEKQDLSIRTRTELHSMLRVTW